MKTINAFVSFSLLLAAAAASACVYGETYLASGWKVHDPSEFEKVVGEIKSKIRSGLETGTVRFDMSGPILTTQTIDGREMLLDGMMFDNLETPRDEMFGDFAILESVDSRNAVEVRWYDGQRRNIIVNPKFLRCMSESAPYAENSVL